MSYVIAAAALGYGTYVVSRWAWNAWNDVDDEEEVEEPEGQPITRRRGQPKPIVSGIDTVLRHDSIPRTVSDPRRLWRLRQQRIERCRVEASQALGDFLPTFRTAIEQVTDTKEETTALKNIRANREHSAQHPQEKELWDAIKLKSLTRMLATAYGHTMLYLLLTLQVHLLGGRLFQEQIEGDQHRTMSSEGTDSIASERMGTYHASHRLVLTQTYDYFFGQGLQLLVDALQNAVESVTQDWDLTSLESLQTSKESFERAIGDIRFKVEGNFSTRRATSTGMRSRSILRFMVPSERRLVATCVQDSLAQAILDETWDLTESPVFGDAQRDSLEITFDLMKEKCWSKIFRDKSQSSASRCSFVDVPLANVVAKLQQTSNSYYKRYQGDLGEAPACPALNQYVPSLERLPTILELGDVSFN